jgi:tetraacyldisaccharide 4'-kinase
VLYLLSKLYELAVRTRIALYEKGLLKTYKLKSPVISVGNLTVGGTGKTPCAAFLADFLQREGHQVAILSRGYKRGSKGQVEVSDGRDIFCGPREAGDEPFLLAKSCPGVRVVVNADRYAAGKWLEERNCATVFILDDGYQHLKLARALNLALVDATDPFTELLPSGRLREPLSGMRRADAVIVTRSDHNFDRSALERRILKYGNIPIFYAYHELTKLRRLDGGESINASALAGRRVAAFSGIARPERFIADLATQRIQVVQRSDFPDHHRYQPAELQSILKHAQKAEVAAIVTTEKDAANLPVEMRAEIPTYAAKIEFRCETMEELKSFVLYKISNVIS